jgi:hypothetical protein
LNDCGGQSLSATQCPRQSSLRVSAGRAGETHRAPARFLISSRGPAAISAFAIRAIAYRGIRAGTSIVAWKGRSRKPAETVELDLDAVDPLHVAEMTSAERALLVARVLEQHPHLAELVPPRLRAVSEIEGGTPSSANSDE